uniref:Uncharacterized protein n=1 Tax=Fervidicoccus fontis TaxID=683846 RepID=A0A7J3ZJG2_9CREN
MVSAATGLPEVACVAVHAYGVLAALGFEVEERARRERVGRGGGARRARRKAGERLRRQGVLLARWGCS